MGFFHSGEPEPPRTWGKVLMQERSQRHRQCLERQLQRQRRPAAKLKGGPIPRVKMMHRPTLVHTQPAPSDPVYLRRRHVIMSLLSEATDPASLFGNAILRVVDLLMGTDPRLRTEFASAYYANLVQDEDYQDADEEEDEPR